MDSQIIFIYVKNVSVFASLCTCMHRTCEFLRMNGFLHCELAHFHSRNDFPFFLCAKVGTVKVPLSFGCPTARSRPSRVWSRHQIAFRSKYLEVNALVAWYSKTTESSSTWPWVTAAISPLLFQRANALFFATWIILLCANCYYFLFKCFISISTDATASKRYYSVSKNEGRFPRPDCYFRPLFIAI